MGRLDAVFGSFQFGQFINFGYTIIWAVFGIIIVSVIAYFVLVIIKYRHKVRVLEVVGDAIQEHPDKAALLKDKDTKKAYEFRLLKGKVKLPPPPADAYVFDKRGKKVVYVAKVSPTDYIYARAKLTDVPLPIEVQAKIENFCHDLKSEYVYVTPSKNLTKKEASLVPIPQDQLFWMANMIEKDGEKYNKELKWYNNPAIMFWGTLGVTLVILILTFKFAGATWQTAQATAETTAMQIISATKGSVGQVVG